MRGEVRLTDRLSARGAAVDALSVAPRNTSTARRADDQPVQSDDTTNGRFRALLADKAHLFQIIVFTCRPDDYLDASSIVSKGKAAHKDTAAGLIRAIDLTRAVQRR
jgi:hypothetical protein